LSFHGIEELLDPHGVKTACEMIRCGAIKGGPLVGASGDDGTTE